MKIPGWVSLPRSTADLAILDRPEEPVDPTRGNTRLTAATGIVLVALLAVKAVTLLSVRQLLTLHVIVGALLIGPVVLKSASTAYRFTRYYSGAPTYRRKGPPPLPLRLLGPLIIVAALAVLGTGVALILVGPSGSGLLLTAHQTSFWFFVAFLAVHLLGHLWDAIVVSWRELRASLSGAAARRRRWRYLSIVLALVVGVGAATLLVPSTSPWTSRPAGHSATARP